MNDPASNNLVDRIEALYPGDENISLKDRLYDGVFEESNKFVIENLNGKAKQAFILEIESLTDGLSSGSKIQEEIVKCIEKYISKINQGAFLLDRRLDAYINNFYIKNNEK